MQAMPSAPTELQENTLACSSANPDFRKHYNWMLATLFNMLTDASAKTGGHGLKIDMTVQDHPRIDVVYV